MSIFEQIELEEQIMKLCRTLHSSLFLDSSSADSSLMSISEVNSLEPSEAIKHMTEALKDLLAHQRNLNFFSKFKSFHNSAAVQSTLQKLESDVREHIKVENQLKLYCDNYEALLEEQEAELSNLDKSNKAGLKNMKSENESLRGDLTALEEEFVKIKGKKWESDLSREPESEIPSENEYKNVIFTEKCGRVKRLREMVKNKELQCKELTKENKEMLDLIKKVEGEKDEIDFPTHSYYKIKYQEKCKEIQEIKKKIEKFKQGSKSQSPLLSTLKPSNLTLDKRKKKSPVRSSSRSKGLLRTLQRPEKTTKL